MKRTSKVSAKGAAKKATAKKKAAKPGTPQQSENAVAWLAQAIGQAAKAAQFCVSGVMPGVDPGLQVDGVGAIAFPLKPNKATALARECQTAPYGKGTETLVNKKVRNTLELDPKKFALSDAWQAAIGGVTRLVAEQLGLPADQLEARVYKLLLYEKGGFFLPHRDSEKHDRMVASLIVVLPNEFSGGELVVRHAGETERVCFPEAAAGQVPCYAAFYADCEHEVKQVQRGRRVCLAYNLVLQPQRALPAPAAAPADPLVAALGQWTGQHRAEPLVFILEHLYSERGRSLELMKGGDRSLAEAIAAAAEAANCHVWLTQIERHVCYSAYETRRSSRYGGRYRNDYDYDDDDDYGDDDDDDDGQDPVAAEEGGGDIDTSGFQIEEALDEQFFGCDWTDLAGQEQPWSSIGLDPAAVVCRVPMAQWKPNRQEYEGYTGNAGNTLDRWYHRSAIVVWPREQHFEVLAKSGQSNSLPMFQSMMAKLAKAPKSERESLRGDCLRFARAIIGRWRGQYYSGSLDGESAKTSCDPFAKRLLKLHDRETISQFLAALTNNNCGTRLDGFVLEACREFGWSAFAAELKALVLPAPPGKFARRDEIPARDMKWFHELCCDPADAPEKAALVRELGDVLVERFCRVEPTPSYAWHREAQFGERRRASADEQMLPQLLQALLAAGLDAAVARVIRFVESAPRQFDLDICRVPTLKKLVPWSQQTFGRVHPELAKWLEITRDYLRSATDSPPEPYPDWSRPGKADCRCRHCATLNAFLADPASESTRIPAVENDRVHLLNSIQKFRCDVKHTLDRQRRPYALLLTKTSASYQRSVKRYEQDCQHLRGLQFDA